MDFDLATIAIVFGAIFLVELPDKTFIATLVLADPVPAAATCGSACAWRSSCRPSSP